MPAGGSGRNELSSWKEIAEYLGVSVRTAQKWETERGLPVRRFSGEKGRVLADPDRLDRWRQGILEKSPWWRNPGFFRVWATAASALLLIAAAAWLLSTRKGPPALFRHEMNTLVVTDASGRELWRKAFPDPIQPTATPDDLLRNSSAWFGDLDGDGRIELLYTYVPTTIEKHGRTLFCFSEEGREKWRFIPGRRVSTRAAEFPPPYQVGGFMPLAPGPDRTRLLVVTICHLAHHPSQVVVLSHQGAILGEYWHSGHLSHMDLADLDGDGSQEILLGGVSNGNRSATLVVLDPRDMGGASSEENPDYQLQGFAPGRERARLLFPRTCINRKFYEYNWVGDVTSQDERIKVRVVEKVNGEPAFILYYLDRELRLLSLEVSDRLRGVHRELEAVGQLDHPLTDKEINDLRNIRYLKRPAW